MGTSGLGTSVELQPLPPGCSSSSIGGVGHVCICGPSNSERPRRRGQYEQQAVGRPVQQVKRGACSRWANGKLLVSRLRSIGSCVWRACAGGGGLPAAPPHLQTRCWHSQ